ncbi:hypothetical protein V6N12_025873 [Hibiscus sabdariffa]|uniref:Uncharacterized protein n=1 Tax=Hibiscus sabdariffa TaxID=183260 RepID=A0ABR2DQ41_9ROSI
MKNWTSIPYPLREKGFWGGKQETRGRNVSRAVPRVGPKSILHCVLSWPVAMALAVTLLLHLLQSFPPLLSSQLNTTAHRVRSDQIKSFM